MRRLNKNIDIKGTGIPGLTGTLIKRAKCKAIYLRSDGYYEVFRIKTKKAETVFGRKLPKRELYPGNERFGSHAICTNSRERAFKYFNELPGTCK